MRRRKRILSLIALAAIPFLLISSVLARAWSAESAERSEVTGLIEAEARGDAAAMLGDIHGCRASAGCKQRVQQDVAALRRSGSVSILELDTSDSFPLTGGSGTARVAWQAGSLPVTQCVKVTRSGNALSGMTVELTEISLRIQTSTDCPARF
jgi:hypothetical protein